MRAFSLRGYKTFVSGAISRRSFAYPNRISFYIHYITHIRDAFVGQPVEGDAAEGTLNPPSRGFHRG